MDNILCVLCNVEIKGDLIVNFSNEICKECYEADNKNCVRCKTKFKAYEHFQDICPYCLKNYDK